MCSFGSRQIKRSKSRLSFYINVQVGLFKLFHISNAERGYLDETFSLQNFG